MPAIQRSEFALALNQVASERGLDVDIVLETVNAAILAAYRKDHPDVVIEEYTAELDPNSGEAKILHNSDDVTPPGFGRIAAQTAKQIILQKIREKEKEAILTDYKVRIGTVVNGMVLRFAGPNIIVDIGKAEGVMPPHEQIQNEKYNLNQRLSVYLKEIKPGTRGDEIIVSRTDNGLLEGLFRREVPEVAQGNVEIKTIVREPGNRSKVAVYSSQSGIDPVGSCVGQKGVRIQAIIQEFNGLEKIDIIQWQDQPQLYVEQALSPAKHVRVEINEADKVAHVFVPQDELSLAIGKEGQNVRLASKLTGYRIEIAGQETPEETSASANEEQPADEGKEEKIEEKLEEAKPEDTTEKETETQTEKEENVAEVTNDLQKVVDPQADMIPEGKEDVEHKGDQMIPDVDAEATTEQTS